MTEYRSYRMGRFVEGGELFGYLQEKGVMCLEMAADVMRQLLSALAYCHKQGIVHRDIKPQNLLLTSRDYSKLHIKVIDFGTASWFSPTAKSLMGEVAGSPYYIAPEVLQHSYNEKCDVWSAGVLLYVLLSGEPPFRGQSVDEVLKAVQKGAFTFSGSRNLAQQR